MMGSRGIIIKLKTLFGILPGNEPYRDRSLNLLRTPIYCYSGLDKAADFRASLFSSFSYRKRRTLIHSRSLGASKIRERRMYISIFSIRAYSQPSYMGAFSHHALFGRDTTDLLSQAHACGLIEDAQTRRGC